MYCPNCNKELEDGALFCDGCGAQITVEEPVAAPEVETVFCPQCGEATDASAPYCQNCGAPVGEEAPAAQPAKKGLPVKALVIGAVAVVAVVAIIIAAVAIFGGKRNSKYVAYLKDAELYFNNFSDESVQVSDRLFDIDGFEKYAAVNYSGDVRSAISMTADGKTMFYPDKVEDVDEYTLYYRDVTDAESAAVKVDSSISSYAINEKGNKIVYMKDAEEKTIGEYYNSYTLGTIKIGAVDETQKVASDAHLVTVNAAFDTVIYYQIEEVTRKDGDTEYKAADYTYYLWQDGEKTKICAGDIGSFYIMDKHTDDGYKKLTKVCYVKEDVLYVQEIGEEAEKIDSDVGYIANVYESGDIYYTKEGKEILYSDLYTFEEEVSDEYKKTVYTTTSDLYCYSDGESALIVEGYSYSQGWAEDEQIAVIVSTDYKNVKKVKTSEENYWSKLYDNIDKATATSVLADGVLTEVDVDDYQQCVMTDDGSSIYFLIVGTEKQKDSEGNETGEETLKDKGELKLVTVKKGTVSAPEDYDSDVSYAQDNYSVRVSLDRNDKPVYYKEYKADKNKATLVIDKEEIDSDVKPGSVGSLKNGSYVYYVDWNSDNDKQCGTLKIYKKGEATVIADDVHSRVVTPDNEVLYLTEYNTEKYRGELYRYNNGKNEKLDEDVMVILNIYVWEED